MLEMHAHLYSGVGGPTGLVVFGQTSQGTPPEYHLLYKVGLCPSRDVRTPEDLARAMADELYDVLALVHQVDERQ